MEFAHGDLPTIRAVMRGMIVIRASLALETLFGISRQKAKTHAPALLRHLGVDA